MLTVPGAGPGVLPPPEFDHLDLRRAAVAGHLGGDTPSFHMRRADMGFLLVCHQQNAVEFDLVARFARESLHPDDVARLDAVLLAAGFDDCVHEED